MNFNYKMIGCLAIAGAVEPHGSLRRAVAEDCPYKDTSLSFEERARDLVRRMSLEEKVSQLGHTADAIEHLRDSGI